MFEFVQQYEFYNRFIMSDPFLHMLERLLIPPYPQWIRRGVCIDNMGIVTRVGGGEG